MNNSPLSPRILVLVRTLVCLQLLFLAYWGRYSFDLATFQIEGLETIYIPKGLFQRLHLSFPSAWVFGTCRALFTMGILAFMLGVLPLALRLMIAFLGVYVLGFPFQFGYEAHFFSPHLLVLFAFCFMKLPTLADLFYNNEAFGSEEKKYRVYSNCLKLIFISVFFTSGIEKLKASGMDYFFTSLHQNSVIISRLFHTDINNSSTLALSKILLENYSLHHFFGLGLLLELISPLALLKLRYSRIVVVLIFCMQLLIYLVMELRHIFYYLPLYLIFLEDLEFQRLWKAFRLPQRRTG